VTLAYEYGMTETMPGLSLSESISAEVFQRSGYVRQIDVTLRPERLLVV